MTPEFAMKLGWAAGKVLGAEGVSEVLIGKDTRASGYMLESALEAGLSAAGVNIALVGPLPTPAIAYLATTFRANAGLVISASHNPFYDNGIKLFSNSGHKLTDAQEEEIERWLHRALEQGMECVSSEKLGKVRRVEDAAGRPGAAAQVRHRAPAEGDGGSGKCRAGQPLRQADRRCPGLSPAAPGSAGARFTAR